MLYPEEAYAWVKFMLVLCLKSHHRSAAYQTCQLLHCIRISYCSVSATCTAERIDLTIMFGCSQLRIEGAVHMQEGSPELWLPSPFNALSAW
jgi:hypothetical protein